MEDNAYHERYRGLDLLERLVDQFADGRDQGALNGSALVEALGGSTDGVAVAQDLAGAFARVVADAREEADNVIDQAQECGVDYEALEVKGLESISELMRKNAETYPADAMAMVGQVSGNRDGSVGSNLLTGIEGTVRSALAESRRAVEEIARARQAGTNQAEAGQEGVGWLAPKAGASPTQAAAGAPAERTGQLPRVVPARPREETQAAAKDGRDEGRTADGERLVPERPAGTAHAGSRAMVQTVTLALPLDAAGRPLNIGDEVDLAGRRATVCMLGVQRVAVTLEDGSVMLAASASLRRWVEDTPELLDEEASLDVAQYALRHGTEASEEAVRRDLMRRAVALARAGE